MVAFLEIYLSISEANEMPNGCKHVNEKHLPSGFFTRKPQANVSLSLDYTNFGLRCRSVQSRLRATFPQ